MSFANKVVIVIGSSSGIGAAAAIAFAKEGANVVITGRNEQKLLNVRKQCVQTGNEPLLVKADISKDDDAKRIVDETIKKFGKIDVLVNNAGIGALNDFLKDDYMSLYDKIMGTNLRALVYITHLAAPHLIKTKGNIINISSVAAMMAGKSSSSYSISKAGMNQFTRNIAVELAPHGVRVNSISPGPVRTDIFESSGFELTVDDFIDSTALKRVSESEELADLILFVASDKAKAVTGSNYVTDNGFLLSFKN